MHIYIFFLHSDRAQEREELYETIIADGQTQYVNITDNAHHYGVIAYRK